jgi:hypothetical protein
VLGAGLVTWSAKQKIGYWRAEGSFIPHPSYFSLLTSPWPPSPDPTEIRFVFIAESSSQSRLLVQHNEQMSYEKEQAGIDEYRWRLVKERRAGQDHSGADIHRVTYEAILP